MAASGSTFSINYSASSTTVAGPQDFLAGRLRRCEELSPNVKGAALSINVFLDVHADDEYEPSSCVELCTQKRVCQTANLLAVRMRTACPSGRSKYTLSSKVFFMARVDRLLCAEFLDFRNRRTLSGASMRTG